ncbi:hypothetical protein [Eubacterium sp.]|uniref:hypothetical protein n=1 Tax=Eubacterium sp. TaxID=142586 RepID=UPI00399B2D51|nr:hypothetical protein [Eubacterium sp.]
MVGRKRKKHKWKYINGTKGIISIFLCLIMTPILSLTGALIEFSRYQNAVQTGEEAVNVSTIATLSNYDKYLSDRFGVFALKQNNGFNLKNTYENYFETNSGVLGKSIEMSNTSASGDNPLSEQEILEQQITDFGETTALTETILNDFNLEKLLKEFDKSNYVTKIADTTANISGFVKSIKSVIEEAEKLKKTIKSVVDAKSSLEKAAKDFEKEIISLKNKLEEDGFEIKVSDNVLEITGDIVDELAKDEKDKEKILNLVLEGIVKDYDGNIKKVVSKGTTLKNALGEFKSEVESVPDQVKNINEKIKKAKEIYNKLKSGTGETEKETVESSVATLKDVLDMIEETITDSASQFKDESINAVKNAIDESVKKIKSDLNLDIWNWSNYSKQDKMELLSKALKGELTGYITEQIKTTTKAIENLNNILSKQIQRAENSIKDAIKNSGIKIIKNLLNTIKSIFDLKVFNDANLNARISDATWAGLINENTPNAYENLLNAVDKLITAGDKIQKLISGEGSLVDLLSAASDIYSSVHEVANSVVSFISTSVNQLANLAGYVTKGDWSGLYNLAITGSYLVHNLPNRVNYNSGIGLTGMKYSDIPLNKSSGNPQLVSGIQNISKAISNGKNGGSDDMFCGAELEYILAGTKSETANQIAAFMNVYVIRMVLDLLPIFQDKEVKAISAIPVVGWVIYVIEILGEPLCDTVLLVNGDSGVGIYKNKCFLSPTGLLTFVTRIGDLAISDKTTKSALKNAVDGDLKKSVAKYAQNIAFKEKFPADYEAHMLFILLLTTNKKTMYTRLANIMQLETSQQYKKEGIGKFSIKKAYTSLKSQTTMKFNSFADWTSINQDSLFKKTIKKNRGY